MSSNDLFFCAVQFEDDNSIVEDMLFYSCNHEPEAENLCDDDIFFYGLSYEQAKNEIGVKTGDFTILSVKPYK